MKKKVILAPDSFKGSASAQRITEIFENEIHKEFPDWEVLKLPMADGGEGTMEIVVAALGGEFITETIKDPLFRDMKGRVGLLKENCAIVEMAEASGLTLVPKDQRNPLKTTTWGTGQLILKALSLGCREIIIGIGGSATNDGGIGAMGAMGAKFLDASGVELIPTAENLGKIKDIDVSGMPPELKDATFTVMCYVDNPLCGENGATYVYGPQKGADEEKLAVLEKGMNNYAQCLQKTFGFDPETPGAGAAGGLGAALKAFLKAELKSGVETVLELYDFKGELQNTGEGRVDGQSARGKVLSGIGKASLKKDVPAIAVAGGLGDGFASVYACGIQAVFPIVRGIITLDYAMEHADALLTETAQRIACLLKIGMKMGKESLDAGRTAGR